MKNKTETVLKTNEGQGLIALFDGWEKHPNWPDYFNNPPEHLNENGNCSLDNLRYDESWDWLIPVVQKTFDTEFFNDFDNWSKLNGKIHKALQNLQIEAVNKAVIEFIRWFNERQSAEG